MHLYDAFRRAREMRTRNPVAMNLRGSVSRPCPALHSSHMVNRFTITGDIYGHTSDDAARADSLYRFGAFTIMSYHKVA